MRVILQVVGVGLPKRLLIAKVFIAGMAIKVGGAPSADPRVAWKAELPAEVPSCDGNATMEASLELDTLLGVDGGE